MTLSPSYTDVHKPLQLVVGKIDAGVAILLHVLHQPSPIICSNNNLQAESTLTYCIHPFHNRTGDHHILEFPTLLLPPDIATGSIIDISVSRNIQAETESLLQFTHLQDAILADLGDTDPTPPKLKAANTSTTSVVLQWSGGLATIPDTVLELLVNDDIIASHPVQPGPLSGECQVDGLEQGYEYTCQVLLRVGTLTVSGELLVVKTLGDREVGSNAPSMAASPSTNSFPKRRASSTTLATPTPVIIPEVSDDQLLANGDKSGSTPHSIPGSSSPSVPTTLPIDQNSPIDNPTLKDDVPRVSLDQPMSFTDMSVLELDRTATIDQTAPNLTFPTPLNKSPSPLTPFNQRSPLSIPSNQHTLDIDLDPASIETGAGGSYHPDLISPLKSQSPTTLLDVISIPLPKSMDSSKSQTPAATSIISSPNDHHQILDSLMGTVQNQTAINSQKDLFLVDLDSSQEHEVATNHNVHNEIPINLSEAVSLKEPENIQLPSSPVMDL